MLAVHDMRQHFIKLHILSFLLDKEKYIKEIIQNISKHGRKNAK